VVRGSGERLRDLAQSVVLATPPVSQSELPQHVIAESVAAGLQATALNS
jgi:hypothetical protein